VEDVKEGGDDIKMDFGEIICGIEDCMLLAACDVLATAKFLITIAAALSILTVSTPVISILTVHFECQHRKHPSFLTAYLQKSNYPCCQYYRVCGVCVTNNSGFWIW
jgi:hypothetical protein